MEFVYLYVGMSGQKMVDALNGNFRGIKSKFVDTDAQLDLRIFSNDVKEVKNIDGILYYTEDDATVEDKNWKPLQGQWGKIGGNLEEQEDLKRVLDGKVNQSSFDNLDSRVESIEVSVGVIRTNLSNLGDLVQNIDNMLEGANGVLFRLDTVESTLEHKISSDQVLNIRSTDGDSLEFTLDNIVWKPVSTAGVVEWGDIIGDITNQPDLFKVINDATEKVDDMEIALNSHLDNFNNPHEVTKEQVGLDKVDNTADVDKPISNAQKEYINNMTLDKSQVGLDEVDNTADINKPISNPQKEYITEYTKTYSPNRVVVISKVNYEALEEKEDTTIYVVI